MEPAQAAQFLTRQSLFRGRVSQPRSCIAVGIVVAAGSALVLSAVFPAPRLLVLGLRTPGGRPHRTALGPSRKPGSDTSAGQSFADFNAPLSRPRPELDIDDPYHQPGQLKTSMFRKAPGTLRREQEARILIEKEARERKEAEQQAMEVDLAAAAEVGLPPLPERTFLVTGATSGIGRYTVELLAKAGCTILVHGREEELVSEYMHLLATEFRDCRVDGFLADLSTTSEVRDLAAEISKRHPVIHGVLHNAATMEGGLKGGRKLMTKEDYEHTVAVNALAPFLLSSLLMENVRASGAGRFIFSSTGTVTGQGRYLKDLCCYKKWDGNHAYSLSKLCLSMMAAEMDERFGDAPRLCFHAIDPGMADTNLMRHGASWGKGRRSGRKWRTTFGLLPHVRTATKSFEALTLTEYQRSSGLQLDNAPLEVSNKRKREELWKDLEQMTGATWPVLESIGVEGDI